LVKNLVRLKFHITDCNHGQTSIILFRKIYLLFGKNEHGLKCKVSLVVE